VVDGFSWGGGGGEEETPGHIQHGLFFSLDDPSFPNSLFYVIYYILNSGGFAAASVSPSRTVPPILDGLDRHVCCSSFDNSTTSSRTEDSEGSAAPRSDTLVLKLRVVVKD